MNPYTQLARKTIKNYIKHNKTIKTPSDLPTELLNQKAGIFICIRKINHPKKTLKNPPLISEEKTQSCILDKNKKIVRDKQLRGCIGTFLPTQDCIAEEIISNAISAATCDPRFYPITPNELNDLEISVDVLSEPEKIDSIDQLDHKKYGVIVKTSDGRSGLLLPDLDVVSSVEEQLGFALQKGGIDPKFDTFELYRFSVTRYNEA